MIRITDRNLETEELTIGDKLVDVYFLAGQTRLYFFNKENMIGYKTIVY
jgi:hypothetical protein